MITIIPVDKQSSEVIFESEQFKARRLEVAPGQRVPLHYHSQCIDLIFPVSGIALLHTETESVELTKKSFYLVDVKKKHSIENIGGEPFCYLLFQSGSYDFVRC